MNDGFPVILIASSSPTILLILSFYSYVNVFVRTTTPGSCSDMFKNAHIRLELTVDSTTKPINIGIKTIENAKYYSKNIVVNAVVNSN